MIGILDLMEVFMDFNLTSFQGFLITIGLTNENLNFAFYKKLAKWVNPKFNS